MSSDSSFSGRRVLFGAAVPGADSDTQRLGARVFAGARVATQDIARNLPGLPFQTTGPITIYTYFQQAIEADTYYPNGQMDKIPTPNRLKFAYDSLPADGLPNADPAAMANAIAAAVHQKLNSAGVRFHEIIGGQEAETRTHAWHLLATREDGTPAFRFMNGAFTQNNEFFGQCREQALLLAQILNMMGVHAQHRHIAAREGPGPISGLERGAIMGTLSQKQIANSTTLYLKLDFAGLASGQLAAYLNFQGTATPAPFWNQGEGCCCVPANQSNPVPVYDGAQIADKAGKKEDQFAGGTYYLGAVPAPGISSTLTRRGDAGVLRYLFGTGVRMRWVTAGNKIISEETTKDVPVPEDAQ